MRRHYDVDSPDEAASTSSLIGAFAAFTATDNDVFGQPAENSKYKYETE